MSRSAQIDRLELRLMLAAPQSMSRLAAFTMAVCATEPRPDYVIRTVEILEEDRAALAPDLRPNLLAEIDAVLAELRPLVPVAA